VLHLEVRTTDDAHGDDEHEADQGELVGEPKAGEQTQGGSEGELAHARFIGLSPR
jgi:hypothetical protein